MVRVVKYWALGGLIVPVGLLLLTQIEDWVLKQSFVSDYIMVALWPSSIILMATYEKEFSAFGILVLAVSILINVVLYSTVGTILWLAFGRLFK